ncbi:adenylosuccinate lyase [Phragmitibacter flavus]|uniref:Adenylosuccinate lyase n=1 Tax=Phragmitibacter flavus TaxID=2576071 RepID=A0A5R8K8E9_9BACT|nr:adenylosuccinate lyase [Phragmitibacter flavus]TLD68608.1 adenylosuccinate lyase [Phragmitibacter flavus]
MTDAIPNVLAERYATPAMRAIWSGEGKVKLERELWIAVMKAQRDLGIPVPAGTIEDYERVKDQVDLDSIMRRERITRHDVKARIEEFCDLAGHEHIHKGMTSRDLTENVEQLQTFRALELVRTKAVAALIKLSSRASQFRDIPLTARTHNVAAQVTTFGKRLAMFGEEFLGGLNALESVIQSYPARGLKGAVGTRLDQISLFEGDAAKAGELDEKVVAYLGLPLAFDAVGQVYPRSLDFRVVAALTDLASGPGSFAKTLRLMAGHELASEGFAKGQVGSSAMPHKMNSRSCERINGFHAILKGHLAMASALAGDQWNEGDVSCSVVRRVMLPDAFLAIDGLLETFLTVLNQMEVFEAVVLSELERYLPFLLTTTVLMQAVKNGAGREAAHEAIKEHAVATIGDLRKGTISLNNLFERLAADPRLGLTSEQFTLISEQGRANTGAAAAQVDTFAKKVQTLAQKHPTAATYQPGDIL